jgi:hypothetical protein
MDLGLVVKWIEDVKRALESAFNFGAEGLKLTAIYNVPPKPRDGEIVLVATVASGSTFNPDGTGNGGFFGYYGGAWHKLG